MGDGTLTTWHTEVKVAPMVIEPVAVRPAGAAFAIKAAEASVAIVRMRFIGFSRRFIQGVGMNAIGKEPHFGECPIKYGKVPYFPGLRLQFHPPRVLEG